MRFKKLLCITMASAILLTATPYSSVFGQGDSEGNTAITANHDYLEYGLISIMSIAGAVAPPPVAIVIGIIAIVSNAIDQS